MALIPINRATGMNIPLLFHPLTALCPILNRGVRRRNAIEMGKGRRQRDGMRRNDAAKQITGLTTMTTTMIETTPEGVEVKVRTAGM